jgi:glycerol-3-phosphate acyltransferase PlsY
LTRCGAAVVAGYLAGSVPFSQIAARLVRQVDLREVDAGTVSGTSLYRVAGFGPLAIAGSADVAKGAIGVLLAPVGNPACAAAAAGAAIVGHNWSPWLRGAGGRGISPAIGALLPRTPLGSATLLAGLAGGRLARQTGIGSLVADLALFPVLGRRYGRRGVWMAAAVLAPMVAKRLIGNGPPQERTPRVYAARLLLDRDPSSAGGGPGT